MQKPKHKKTNQLRIIGGQWRGRKITCPDIPGLRPTPDRVRETLFNWLAPVIVGARCLDLFCGSGALGLEALSRGASHVVMVDESPKVIDQLRKQIQIFATDKATLLCAQVPEVNLTTMQPFDIIFLDPPFHKGLINKCSAWLENQDLLASNALIYIETEAELAPPPIPNNWQIIKSKSAGQVRYYLAQRD